jgi:predicted TIM-barrel fold metal-dependent hydrolase
MDEAWASFVSGTSIALSRRDHDYPPGLGGHAALTTLDQLTAVKGGRQITILSCTSMDEVYRNPAFSAVAARAINDWIRAEWLDRDTTLRASMVVSTEDIEDAVAEVERLGDDDRFVQVLLPVRNNVRYGSRHFHPLYAAAQGHGKAIALHAWGRPGLAMTPNGIASTFLVDYMTNIHTVQLHVLSLVTEGVFARYDKLRVVLQECGFLWLAHLAARFDKEWRGVHREVPWVSHLPSEYIRRHMRATTAPAHLGRDPCHAAEALRMIGASWLLYASDYPHEHGDDDTMLWRSLDQDEVMDLSTRNAASFYGLALQ